MSNQHILEAAQTASLLVSDIHQAHKAACESDPFLEILLRDLISSSVAIQLRLEEIERAAK